MLYLKLAFRNVFRNTRRSLLTVSCITAGICAILVIGGYYEYNYYGLRESLRKSHYAHVQLYKKGYLGNEETDPFSYLIENPDEVIEFPEEAPRVVIATPRLMVWGMLNKQSGSVVQYCGGYFRIILFITCVIAFFTTLNTIMMTISEKITEIGTMRSFGLTRFRISAILFYEAPAPGVLGCIAGAAVSFLTAVLINYSGGIYVAPPPGAASGFYAEIMIVPANLLLALLVTGIPAVKTHNMQIVEQLNYNETR